MSSRTYIAVDLKSFYAAVECADRQLDLFADITSEEKDDRLSKALDAINTKYDLGTIFHLSEGVKKPWQRHADSELHGHPESEALVK